MAVAESLPEEYGLGQRWKKDPFTAVGCQIALYRLAITENTMKIRVKVAVKVRFQRKYALGQRWRNDPLRFEWLPDCIVQVGYDRKYPSCCLLVFPDSCFNQDCAFVLSFPPAIPAGK